MDNHNLGASVIGKVKRDFGRVTRKQYAALNPNPDQEAINTSTPIPTPVPTPIPVIEPMSSSESESTNHFSTSTLISILCFILFLIVLRKLFVNRKLNVGKNTRDSFRQELYIG